MQIKWLLKIGIFILGMGCFFMPVSFASSNQTVTVENDKSDNGSADNWFTTQNDKRSKNSTDKVEDKHKVPVRFQQILQDNSYTYYMDTESARWITCPHTSDEQIIDVWIKLLNTDTNDANGSYSYPQKYYLEHYYVRPDTQQIQFLSELEVTGRPSNSISERTYSAANWENLVPGSIEDTIYRAVVANMKTLSKKKGGPQSSVRDALEEYLRISL